MMSFFLVLFNTILLTNSQLPGTWNTNIKTTVYGTGDGGNCYADTVVTATFPFSYIVAVGGINWNNGNGCGACYEIQDGTTNNLLTVQAVDQCPECGDNHLDLSTSSWNSLTNNAPGGIGNVQYRRVSCPYTNQNINIVIKSGSSRHHIEFYVRNINNWGTLSKAEVRDSSGIWITCPHEPGQGFYKCGSTQLSTPLQDLDNIYFRLTDSGGNIITSPNAIVTNNQYSGTKDFGTNFATIDGTLSPAKATTISPTPPTSSIKYIDIINYASTQIYWVAFYINNIGCGTIQNVYIKDSVNYQTWWSCSWNNAENIWQCDNQQCSCDSDKFTTPISIKLVNSNTEELIFDNIINDLNSGTIFSTNKKFCQSPTSSPIPTTINPTLAPVPTTMTPSIAPSKPTASPPGYQCVNGNPSNFIWKGINKMIQLNGIEFNMKGVSWFGFETDWFVVHGLDKHSMAWYFNFLKTNSFNAIRVPFSADLFNNNPTLTSSYVSQEPKLQGKSAINALDIFIDTAAEYGMLIMLDFHSVANNQYTEGLGSTTLYETKKQTWIQVSTLYKSKWNVFMADLFNEPHDITPANWGNWIDYCELVGNALIDQGTNWLMAVQGTDSSCVYNGCSSGYCNWGENLVQLACGPNQRTVNLKEPNRVVYSPHVYGPSIGGNPYGTTYWNERWGFIASSQTIDAPIVIGEFGTTYTGDDIPWFDQLVEYLQTIEQRDTFFWTLNYDSGDTRGLVKSDWTTPETAKLQKLAQIQPNPTDITYDPITNKVCYYIGSNTIQPTVSPFPSKTPTIIPTKNPAPPTTLAPVPTNGGFIRFETIVDHKSWWVAFYIQNIGCGTIAQAYIKDDAVYTDWVPYSTNSNGYYAFDNTGLEFSLNIDVKLVNSFNEILIFNDIITSFGGPTVFTTTQNFCRGTSSPSSKTPTNNPITKTPTKNPVTKQPTTNPISKPPTTNPVSNPPTKYPTKQPSNSPIKTNSPTKGPVTESPTTKPTTKSPTSNPLTNLPTKNPNKKPTNNPIKTDSPTMSPTKQPITKSPSMKPTKDPTTGPVTPTNKPSKAPTNNDVAGIVIEFAQGDKWWFAFFIKNIECTTIVKKGDSVMIKDSGYYKDEWLEAESWSYWWSFNNVGGNPFVLPISIKITDVNGVSKVLSNIITSFDVGKYQASQYFCTQTQLNSLSNENGNGKGLAGFNDFSNYTGGNWVLFILMLLGIIIIIGVIIYCICKKVNKKEKVNETLPMTIVSSTPAMSPVSDKETEMQTFTTNDGVTTTNIIAVDDDE